MRFSEDVGVRRRIERRSTFFYIDGFAPLAQVPEDVVSCYAIEKRTDISAARIEAFRVPQQRQKHLLRDFFRHVLPAGHMQREPVHPPCRRPVQRGKRLFVAEPGPAQKFFV